MDDARDCGNCGRAMDVSGQKFCPDCGQPTPAHRIDWHFLGHELEHSVLHMDRGIFYTLKNLMIRPGHMIRDYLAGRRAGIVKPLLLIMILAALIVLASKFLLDGDMTGAKLLASAADGAAAKGDQAGAREARIGAVINDWMNRHFAASTIMLLPLEAAMFRLAFGRVGKLNYPEWLVITAFLTVQTFVLWLLTMPLHSGRAGVVAWVLLLSLAYGMFTLVQLFNDYPRWKTMVRTFIGFSLFMVASQVVMGMVVAGWLLLGGAPR